MCLKIRHLAKPCFRTIRYTLIVFTFRTFHSAFNSTPLKYKRIYYLSLTRKIFHFNADQLNRSGVEIIAIDFVAITFYRIGFLFYYPHSLSNSKQCDRKVGFNGYHGGEKH